MIVVSTPEIEQRLGAVWQRLQKLEQGRVPESLSQVALDEQCVARLEQTLGYLEAEASRK